jgi:hypothetical protein
MVIFGGVSLKTEVVDFNDLWQLDLQTWKWTSIQRAPSALGRRIFDVALVRA